MEIGGAIVENAVVMTITVSDDSYDPDGAPPANVLLEIVGDGKNIRMKQGGVDVIGAIVHALRIASIILYASEAWKEGRLFWSGTRDLGLPGKDDYSPNRTTSPFD